MGRVVAEPMEIPVGIIMAIVGVPFFLYLLRGGIKSARK
ncbi:iron chelate uptake ABC transporter family permease subunit [Zhenhengia sp.]